MAGSKKVVPVPQASAGMRDAWVQLHLEALPYFIEMLPIVE